MRILLINQPFYPDTVATSRHLTEIAVYLQQKGHKVEVIASRRNYSQPSQIYAKEEYFRGVHIHRVSCTGFGKRNIFTRLVDAISFKIGLLWSLLRLKKPDLVVTLTTPPLIGFVTTVYSKLRGIRCAQYVMDMHPHTAVELGYVKRHSPITKLLYQMFRFTMRNSFRVIVLDRWMGKTVVKYGAKPDSVRVVPLWPTVSFDDPPTTRTENPFRKAHQLGDKFVLLYSGNHGIAHPLDTILQAAVKLRMNRDIVFLFVGGGDRTADVAHYIETHELSNVCQLPFQPNHMLQHSLNTADVHFVVMGESVTGLIHPSKIYGVMAVGKPYIFVGPENSHVVDLLNECPSGYHVRHNDVNGLVKTIEQLKAQSASQREAMGKKNETFVNERFNAHRIIEKFSQALN